MTELKKQRTLVRRAPDALRAKQQGLAHNFALFLIGIALFVFATSAMADAVEFRVHLRDHLGNVTTITDEKGNVLQRNVITP